jgi:glycosyltransferase involved in cell wall biosynthesis
LKGITIAIRAFAAFIRQGGVGRFTLVGKGPEEARGRKLAKDLGVDHLVDWISWVDQSELDRIYAGHDLFLFPSLHDSSGNVVVEAMCHGLPVMCFDLGGPAQIVTMDSGVVVATAGLSAHGAADALGRALKQLFDDHAEFDRLSRGAHARAREFAWPVRVAGVIKEFETAIGHL